MRKNQQRIKLYIPTWISVSFTLLAILLVPWTIFLAYSLPTRHLVKHWDIAWVGLDIAIILLLLLSGFLASIKSRLVIITLSFTASFLLVDAWFDVVTSRPGKDLYESLFLAIFIEFPIAITCLTLAYSTINKNVE